MAYHITWGTYGTRLSGTDRPHVDRDHNQYGQPLAPANASPHDAMRASMKYDPVYLTLEQRQEVVRAIDDLAARYQWEVHTKAAQRDHVHVVITAPREGEMLRDALKAVATKFLNKRFGGREWWAEKGSAKYLVRAAVFDNAFDYVDRQREF